MQSHVQEDATVAGKAKRFGVRFALTLAVATAAIMVGGPLLFLFARGMLGGLVRLAGVSLLQVGGLAADTFSFAWYASLGLAGALVLIWLWAAIRSGLTQGTTATDAPAADAETLSAVADLDLRTAPASGERPDAPLKGGGLVVEGGRRRPRFIRLLVYPALVTAIALPLEWATRATWLPDFLSAVPLLTMAILLGLGLAYGAVRAALGLARWVIREGVRYPFFGGICFAVSLWLSLSVFQVRADILQAARDTDRNAAPLPALDAHASCSIFAVAADEEIRIEPDGIGELGLAPAWYGGIAVATLGGLPPGADEYSFDECAKRLGPTRGKDSYFEKAQAVVRNRYCMDAEDAADLAMEALISVCTSESLAAYERLPAVYVAAAKRRALNLLRKRARREDPDWTAAVVAEVSSCVLGSLPDTRLRTEVELALQAFQARSNTEQEAIKLQVRGYSHREIATMVPGISADRESRDLIRNALTRMHDDVVRMCPQSDDW